MHVMSIVLHLMTLGSHSFVTHFLFINLKKLLHLFYAYVFIFVHHVYIYIMVGTHTHTHTSIYVSVCRPKVNLECYPSSGTTYFVFMR